MSDHQPFMRGTRRDFLRVASAGAGAALVGSVASAHHHPRPMPQSMQYLDQHMYIENMEIVAHIPGRRGGALRMMTTTSGQRLVFSGRDALDVTDARNPKFINEGKAPGGELAYNAPLKKWVKIGSVQAPTPSSPGSGKYEDPSVTKLAREYKGLRGIRLFDVTDPTSPVPISEYSTGQTGSGPHGDSTFWDGGKYCYLACAPDDTFTHQLAQSLLYSHCLMIVDVSDPANVKPVANWWVPGQRNTEVEEFKKWQSVKGRIPATLESTKTIEAATKAFRDIKYVATDRAPRTWLHGPAFLMDRQEDGCNRMYSGWSSLGFIIHDVSNIKQPKMIGRFEPPAAYGGLESIPFHDVWLGALPRGYVIGVPEAMNPDCNEVWCPTWVLDVRDETNPTPIAMLPRPRPPKEAPYTDFCFARGRFGPHVPPAQTGTPGRQSETFLPLACFNAGVQCYDLTEIADPKIVAYFIPPHAGTLSPECRVPLDPQNDAKTYDKCEEESNTFNRPTDTVYVEWDRKLVYACTTSGVYILSTPALGKPTLGGMKVTEWAMPGVNKGAPV